MAIAEILVMSLFFAINPNLKYWLYMSFDFVVTIEYGWRITESQKLNLMSLSTTNFLNTDLIFELRMSCSKVR